MPLVRTPMIAPSNRLNPIPAISAEHAAAMVIRGLVEKPVRIDAPLGTLSEAGRYLTPKLTRRVLHQLYLGYPDSAAARGEGAKPAGVPGADHDADTPAPAATPGPVPARRQPKAPVRAVRSLRVPRPVKRAIRVLPGVHW
jgi:hypothetical protein